MWTLPKVSLGTCMNVALALLFVGAGVWSAAQAIEKPVFDLRTLTVTNPDDMRVTASAVQAVVDEVVDGNYFTVDLARVRAAVETLPWVKSAVVRRVFPNRLEVTVERHVARALYEDGRLVNDKGELFAANPEEAGPQALPMFYGPAGSVDVMLKAWADFETMLSPLGVRVTDLQVSDRGGWSLVFSGPDTPPTKVELGRDETGYAAIGEHLKEVAAVYPRVRALLKGPPSSLDLRYSHAFAAAMPDKKLVKAWSERQKRTENAAPGEAN